MKYILILLLLASCKPYRWVAVEKQITISGKRISFKETGKVINLPDTTFTGYLLKYRQN